MVQPLLVSLSALNLATECVRMMLKIDGVVSSAMTTNLFVGGCHVTLTLEPWPATCLFSSSVLGKLLGAKRFVRLEAPNLSITQLSHVL